MLPENRCPSRLLDIVMEAEREIAAAEGGEAYALYECLHRIASRIAAADAFYVCLYSDANQSLLFPYNFDRGWYDYPVTVPLGDGPTSCVVRTKRPYLWNTEEEARRVPGIRFGDMDSVTLSAVHVPIPHPGTGPDAPVLGVLSAHAYRAGMYDPATVRVYQWLADRAGVALSRARSAAEAERRRQAAMADAFVRTLFQIGRDVQALRGLVPPQDLALRQALTDLMRRCQRAQTEANALPLSPPDSVLPPQDDDAPAADEIGPLAGLTEREREILCLMASGHDTEEIATRLYVSPNTIKDHIKRIFRKLGVNSRLQAVRLLSSHSGSPTRSGG